MKNEIKRFKDENELFNKEIKDFSAETTIFKENNHKKEKEIEKLNIDLNAK